MSAYIVQDRTINRIVTWLTNQHSGLDFAFQRLGYDVQSKREDAERLAVDLHLLNCDAVDGRYGKGTSAHDVAVCFEYRRCLCPPTVDARFQVYKHAQCLRYQCSEADIPDRELYKALTRFCFALADSILRDNPKYEACERD